MVKTKMTTFKLSEHEVVAGYFPKDKINECIEQIELDLLKKFKMASIPIIKIIKNRTGDLK